MKPSEVKTVEDVRRIVEEQATEFVTVGLVDTQGMLRGKYLSRRKFLSAVEHGMGVPAVTLGLDYNDVIAENAKISDARGGYYDALVRVIPDSCRVVPFEPPGRDLFFQLEYADATTAICPRNVFKRVLAKADAMGLVPLAGLEYEFTLFHETPMSLIEKGFKNLRITTPYKTYYVLQRQSVWSEFYNAIMDACRSLDIPIDSMHEEMGPGFMEATIAYGPGPRVPDNGAIFKSYAKAVAQRRDLMMTFMARWSNGADGHSGHVHLSLKDQSGKPVFHDAGAPHGMSTTMRHFVGGMQSLMPELLLMLAPNVNSFKRLVPGIFAPIAAVWGIENRSCAIRVIPGEPDAQRVECRTPGADANPYFSIGALAAAGLWGIEHELEPSAPMMQSAYHADIAPEHRFPASFGEAIERFRASKPARAIFGDAFVDHYADTRAWQEQEFRALVTDRELERFFELG
ncbi:MAG: glutamine synthetase [Alphaproteobacteria bacterium]